VKLANRHAGYLSSPPLIRAAALNGYPALRGRRLPPSPPYQANRQEVNRTKEKRPTPKKRLGVSVLTDEEADIKKMTASTGLSVAVYLRNLSLGYASAKLTEKAVLYREEGRNFFAIGDRTICRCQAATPEYSILFAQVRPQGG
jgi:hypothetical protein